MGARTQLYAFIPQRTVSLALQVHQFQPLHWLAETVHALGRWCQTLSLRPWRPSWPSNHTYSASKAATKQAHVVGQMVQNNIAQGSEALPYKTAPASSFTNTSACHVQVVPDLVTQGLEAFVALKSKCPGVEGPSLPVAELRQHAQPVEQAQMTRHIARLAQVAHGVRELHGYA